MNSPSRRRESSPGDKAFAVYAARYEIADCPFVARMGEIGTAFICPDYSSDRISRDLQRKPTSQLIIARELETFLEK